MLGKQEGELDTVVVSAENITLRLRRSRLLGPLQLFYIQTCMTAFFKHNLVDIVLARVFYDRPIFVWWFHAQCQDSTESTVACYLLYTPTVTPSGGHYRASPNEQNMNDTCGHSKTIIVAPIDTASII